MLHSVEIYKTCPKCKNNFEEKLEGIFYCDEQKDHKFCITLDKSNNLYMIGYYCFYKTYYSILFEFYYKEITISTFDSVNEQRIFYGINSEIDIPWFEPDLDNFQNTIDKVNLYATFS